MIRINNLTFSYGSDESDGSVGNISLHVPKGQCIMLCGPSGCGKTTLLRIVSGLIPSQYGGDLSGEILIDGKNPSSLTSEEKAHLIGMVFQDPRSQFFMSSVREEIAFSGENLGYSLPNMRKMMEAQCIRLNIQDLLERKLNHLSSGQKQKVAIASSNLLSPKLLLLDEPSANLDAHGTEILVDILKEIKNSGTTIVICEHRLHSFLPVVDRFICLKKGVIIKEWTASEFAALSSSEAVFYSLRHPGLIEKFSYIRPVSKAASIEYRGDNLSFRYRNSNKGFSDLSFHLTSGTITAVTGKNGCGKTTLCKIICGLLTPNEGTLFENGKRIRKAKLRQNSYFVMQDADYQLFTESVGNELVLGRTVNTQLRDRAYEAMNLFELTSLKERHPASLSGGEKQRVTLAAAWCSDAKLIVLDEPTSGLDARHAQKVAEYMCRLAESDKIVLVITHDPLLIALAGENRINMDEVSSYC